MTPPVIPDEAVEALVDAWDEEGWSWPYMARVSHFTEEQIAAGMLAAADAESNANNRDFARTLVTAAAPPILAANAPRVIRGRIISINSWRWHWVVSRPGVDGEAGDALDWGESTTLPAAYDRCAAAVTKAREEA